MRRTCSTVTRLVPLPKFSNSSLYASCPTGESESAAAMVCGRVPFTWLYPAPDLEPAEKPHCHVLLGTEVLERTRCAAGEGKELQHVVAQEAGRSITASRARPSHLRRCRVCRRTHSRGCASACRTFGRLGPSSISPRP